MRVLLILTLFVSSIWAVEREFSRELILPGSITFDADNGDRTYGLKPAVGLELLTSRSDEYGDYLLENYQVRFSYDLTKDKPKDSWALELHNFWWEFKLNLGKRLRVGHLQPHFGLESSMDTHGKFFQTLAMKSMGMKHDWGVAHTRYFGILDFATSLTLGNGMSLHKYDNTYLATARLSSPDREIFRGGISILYGNTLSSMEMKTFPQPMKMGTLQRALFGLDGRYRGIRNDFLFETYLGAIEEKLAMGLLLRSEIPSKDKILFLIQGTANYSGHKKRGRSEVSVYGGFNYTILKKFSFETQVGAVYNYSNDDLKPVVKAQLYYFGD